MRLNTLLPATLLLTACPGETNSSSTDATDTSTSTTASLTTEVELTSTIDTGEPTTDATTTTSSTSNPVTSTSTTSESTSTSTTGEPSSCGNGVVEVGEECDDSNDATVDWCTDCAVTGLWKHEGVATQVPSDYLAFWEPCWSATFFQTTDTTWDVLAACTGDHILMACRRLEDDYYQVAAHAPRDDVFFLQEVDYQAGEVHWANDVGWIWAPSQAYIGFRGELGVLEERMRLGWGLWDGELGFSRLCGTKAHFANDEYAKWERVIFQAWD